MALRGARVTISARVTNIGDVAGTYADEPRVDGAALTGAPVSLAPGTARTVTWTVAGDRIGSHELRLGQFAGTFRVRSPLITVHASTTDGRPLLGATVSLVQDGFPVPFGVTDRDGRVTAELPVERASAAVTAVVGKAPSGRSSGYLLTVPVRVDGADVEGTLAGNNAAVLDLAPRKGTAESLTYVSPGLAPAAAVAVPPGQVVVTAGQYSLRHAYRTAMPEREWWALSVPRDFPATKARRYKVEFGGVPRSPCT